MQPGPFAAYARTTGFDLVTLQVRRSANAVYFWTPETPRRGRPRKNPASWPPLRLEHERRKRALASGCGRGFHQRRKHPVE